MTHSETSSAPAGRPAISRFTLDNGMEVVVIPDHRAPVVTHMVWYRNGGADDPACKSGIAHFLEHLMFKGTEKHPKGVFSEMVAELGGQENAFTSWDYTAYYQRVPKEHLHTVMGFEADRMVNLVLTDEVVAPERDVVLEERRMRIENDPGAQLQEAALSALYSQHPYGRPIIGFEHEIETLDRDDALAYYRRFYTPENAILVIAGDVDAATVRDYARDTYAAVPARNARPERVRPQEPPPRAHRHVALADDKVEQPSVMQLYLTPSHATAAPGESETLQVLAHLMGGGPTSRLYRELVVDRKIAVAAGVHYMAESVDATSLWVWGVPAPDTTLADLDAALSAIIADMGRTLVDPADLARAKTRLIADAVYAQDSQTALAMRYGSALATGVSLDDVEAWPDRIDAVTAEGVRAAAATWLLPQRCVSALLEKKEHAEQAAA